MRVPNPTVEQVTVHPEMAPVRVNATPQDFGAAAGEALNAAGGATVGADVAVGQITNENAVNDAYAGKFSNEFRGMTAKYYSLQGKDAVEQLPQYEQQANELRESVRDSLGNSAQKMAFDQMARYRSERELDSMARYADQQNKVWQQTTHNAMLHSDSQIAADHPHDEQAFGQAVGSGLAEIDRYARATGQSEPEVAASRQQFLSVVWSKRIRSAMLQDPLAAQQLYKANRSSIDANLRPQLEDELLHAVMPQYAEQDALKIIGNNGGNAKDVRANLGDWIKQADATALQRYPDQPVYRHMLEGEIYGRAEKVISAQEALARNARDQVMGAIMGQAPAPGQAAGPKPTTLNALLATPAMRQAWSDMDPQAQLAAMTMLRRNAGGNDPPFSDSAARTYHDMRGEYLTDPARFHTDLATNFHKLAQELPHGMFMSLVSLDTHKGAALGPGARSPTDMLTSRVKSATLQIFKSGGFAIPGAQDTDPADTGPYRQFISRMVEAGQQFADTHKRLPTDAELQDMANALMVQGYQSGSGHTWFGYTFGRDKLYAFQAAKPPDFEATVPPQYIGPLTEEYKKTHGGREPTAQDLTQGYLTALRWGRVKP